MTKAVLFLTHIFFLVSCHGQNGEQYHRFNSHSKAFFDQQELMDKVDGYLKHNKTHDPLVLLTPEPINSSVSKNKIKVWVNASSAYHYINNQDMQDKRLPEGTVVLREVLDEQGNIIKVTAAAQMWQDYNPDSFDMWFAVSTEDGEIINDDNGKPQEGALHACNLCHSRLQNGFYGLPSEVHSSF